MMDKSFDRFLPETKNILIRAQKIAEKENQPIMTDHILAAIVQLQNSVAFDILTSQGLDPDKLSLSLSIIKKKKAEKRSISKEGKDLLKKAMSLAKEYHHRVVAPEHLLLAIVSSKNCQAFQILKDLELSPSQIKKEVVKLFAKAEQINKDGLMPTGIEELITGDMEEMPGLGTGLMVPRTKRAKNQNILATFSTDLVNEARKNRLDPLIGRERELERTIKILNRRTKNNPVLVGEAGVGKTAIVEGLAQRIASGNVPSELKDKIVLNLDLGLLLAGTKYRGQFEERVKKIIKEIKENPRIILFLDEIHTLAGAGAAEGSIDAANIIKPSLAKGQLRLIGSTTLDEYQKYIEKDKALERRLQVVKVDEPTPEETVRILRGLKRKYEDHHQVRIEPSAINAAVDLADRYISDRHLPDKAIDLIDEACSAQSMASTNNKKTNPLVQLQQEVQKVIKAKEKAVIKQDYEEAAKQREKEMALKSEIVKKQHQNRIKKKNVAHVTDNQVAQVVSEWTGVPVTNLVQKERERYQSLEKKISKKIVGQKPIIKKVVQAIKRSRTGIAQEGRPIGSFIFLGPTGVGKTELAKVLAEALFDRSDALIRIDMSEFMERHNTSKLIGAPPGYVGYEEGGKLTEQVRQNPYSVILLDEIEKSHSDVQNILLQILEDGQITDGQGRKVDFSNTVIILTSNIGTKALSQEAAVGFQALGSEKNKTDLRFKKMKQQILTRLKEKFRPEFINRIDEILVFTPLSPSDIKSIVKIQIKELKERLKKQKGIKLEISDRAIDYLKEKGFHPDLGARPVRRIITREIENQISERILEDKKGPANIKVVRRQGKGLKII